MISWLARKNATGGGNYIYIYLLYMIINMRYVWYNICTSIVNTIIYIYISNTYVYIYIHIIMDIYIYTWIYETYCFINRSILEVWFTESQLLDFHQISRSSLLELRVPRSRGWNTSHLKMYGWNTCFLIGAWGGLFSGVMAVSLFWECRGCRSSSFWKLRYLVWKSTFSKRRYEI